MSTATKTRPAEIVKTGKSLINITCEDIASEKDPRIILEHLSDLFATTVHSVRLMAACVKRLDELGVDLSTITDRAQRSALDLIRKVVNGTLLPEAVVAFELPGCLRAKLPRLSLHDQQQCVENKSLTVYLLNGDSRKIAPSEMKKDDVAQVFGPTGIRTEGEQIAFLHDKIRKETIKEAVNLSKTLDIVVDKKGKCLVINGVKIPARELARYLAEIAG